MIVQPFPSGPFATNAYIVACAETKEAAIVDPAPGSCDLLTDYCVSHHLTPKILLLTHSHWDHIADVACIKERWNLPVCVHTLDAPNLENPGADRLPCPLPIAGVRPDQLLSEGEQIKLGKLLFYVIHTPGHTPGGVCYYCPAIGIILTGDTLFRGSIGNVSFPTSNPEKMWESLEKLNQLPAETKVYPGHGSSTSISKESWLGEAKKIFGEQ